MQADHEITTGVTAFAQILTPPVAGKVRLVKTVTIHNPDAVNTAVVDIAIRQPFPLDIHGFGPVSILPGATAFCDKTMVITDNEILKARATGGPTVTVTVHFLEELENAENWIHRHGIDGSAVIQPFWTNPLSEPSTGVQYAVTHVSFWDAGVTNPSCWLAIETVSGPTYDIIHNTGVLVIGATVHFEEPIAIVPGTRLATRLDVNGVVYTWAHYACHRMDV